MRYREIGTLWARRLCLASDILNTTFVSLTVVGVLTVSFELAIYLPDVARSQEIPEKVDLGDLTRGQSDIIRAIDELGGPIPPAANVSNLATIQEINRLIEELRSRRDLYSIILQLHEAHALSENSLAREVGEVLGNMGAYNSVSLEGIVPEGGGTGECHKEEVVQCHINGR